MARTIRNIQEVIIADIQASHPTLSSSAVAEWRLWSYVMAVAIHTFELIHDSFRAEIDAVADKITPGTARWYVQQCKRWQNGHELLFDDTTAQLYYAVDDAASRIISVVAVTEAEGRLGIKVAKMQGNKIVPLTSDELYDFDGYVDCIKFAGVETQTISTQADKLLYDIDVIFDPAIPVTSVKAGVVTALDSFRTALDFNSMLYKQRLVDAVMSVKGVVTVDLKSLKRKGSSMVDFAPVGVADELESGYFDYDNNSVLTLTSSRA